MGYNHKPEHEVECPKCGHRVAISNTNAILLRHIDEKTRQVCEAAGTSAGSLPRFPRDKRAATQRSNRLYSRRVTRDQQAERAKQPPWKTMVVTCPNPRCLGRDVAITSRGKIIHHLTVDRESCTYIDSTGLERRPYSRAKMMSNAEWFYSQRKKDIVDTIALDQGGTRSRHYNTQDGLCPVCKQWQRLTLEGLLYRHGSNGRGKDCPGNGGLPDRTRPIGAWKRRIKKRKNNGTQAES